MSGSQVGHIHLQTYLTLPGPLHHQPIQPGRHQHPSWVQCKTEQRPSCPELFVHRPSWDGRSPACCPDCHPSLPGPPPGTGHCHTAAALPDSALPTRGKGLSGGLEVDGREAPFKVYTKGCLKRSCGVLSDGRGFRKPTGGGLIEENVVISFSFAVTSACLLYRKEKSTNDQTYPRVP